VQVLVVVLPASSALFSALSCFTFSFFLFLVVVLCVLFVGPRRPRRPLRPRRLLRPLRLQATSGCDDVTEDFWHEREGLRKATRGTDTVK